jgi:DNA-directed RNA polymerase subunit RPC12/RpoP
VVIDSKSYHHNKPDGLNYDPRGYFVKNFGHVETPISRFGYITNSNDEGCACENCGSRSRVKNQSPRFIDYWLEYDKENEKPPSDHFYFLCDAVVYGYALKERKWGMFIFEKDILSLMLFSRPSCRFG